MTFLKSRSGATRVLGCPDVVGTAPDGYTDPLIIDSNSGGLFLGGDWIVPTLLNGWANFGAGNQTAQYRRVGEIVQIRGLVSGGTMSAAIFTFPAGYRAPSSLIFASISNSAIGQLLINSTGDVVPQSGSNVWFSVNCQFSITP